MHDVFSFAVLHPLNVNANNSNDLEASEFGLNFPHPLMTS